MYEHDGHTETACLHSITQQKLTRDETVLPVNMCLLPAWPVVSSCVCCGSSSCVGVSRLSLCVWVYNTWSTVTRLLHQNNWACHLLHEELHWLDVQECIHYKLGVTVHRCLQYKAPEYLVNCCTPVSDIPSRRHLRSATRLDITWPYHGTSSAPLVVGPSLSLVRWSGTRYRTVSATRHSPSTASDNRWRWTYFVVTTQHTQRSRGASWLCGI